MGVLLVIPYNGLVEQIVAEGFIVSGLTVLSPLPGPVLPVVEGRGFSAPFSAQQRRWR